MKYQYYKNDNTAMSFYPDEDILRVESENVNVIGSMDKKYVTYVIKSNKSLFCLIISSAFL